MQANIISFELVGASDPMIYSLPDRMHLRSVLQICCTLERIKRIGQQFLLYVENQDPAIQGLSVKLCPTSVYYIRNYSSLRREVGDS